MKFRPATNTHPDTTSRQDVQRTVDSLDETLRNTRTCALEPGVPVFSYNETIEKFYLLQNGLIGLYRFIQPNKRILLRKILPGESVGVTQILLDDPYPGHLIPIKESTVLKGDSNELKKIRKKQPGLLNDLILQENQAHGRTYNKLTTLLAGNISERLAEELLELSNQLGRQTDAGLEIDLKLTRKEIARMVGCTPESASRVMSQWEEEGRIQTNQKKITIRQPDELRSEF